MEQGRAAQAADGARAGAPVAHADDFADLDRRLVLATQGGLPLVPRPYAAVADGLGVNEALVRERLAAIAVPEARWAEVVEAVNAFPEVAHNYRREHALNMWFVLATETRDGIADCGRRIEAATGLVVHLFPKEREYFVEMRLEA